MAEKKNNTVANSPVKELSAAEKEAAEKEAAEKALANAGGESPSVASVEGEDDFVSKLAEQLKEEKAAKLKISAEKKAERDAAKNAKNPRKKDTEALIS